MTDDPLAIYRRARVAIPEDRLDQLRAAAVALREKKQRVVELEEEIKRLNKDILQTERQLLPQMFYEAGVDRVGLPATGNQPACDAVLRPFYYANIAAAWPAEKRATAFAVLEQLGLGDLAKVNVTVSFPKGDQSKAEQLQTYLDQRHYPYKSDRVVSHMTLTAAIKAQCQKGISPSSEQLEAIGAYVGDVVELKPRKD